jgi:hypothetical protein
VKADNLEFVLYQSFLKMYHEDRANAAMHCAEVRYSPLTFRLAEALEDHLKVAPSNEVYPDVYTVLLDKGTYDEDPGR